MFSTSSTSPASTKEQQPSYADLKNSYDMAWKMMDASLKDAESCRKKIQEFQDIAERASLEKDAAVSELATVLSDQSKKVLESLQQYLGNTNTNIDEVKVLVEALSSSLRSFHRRYNNSNNNTDEEMLVDEDDDNQDENDDDGGEDQENNNNNNEAPLLEDQSPAPKKNSSNNKKVASAVLPPLAASLSASPLPKKVTASSNAVKASPSATAATKRGVSSSLTKPT